MTLLITGIIVWLLAIVSVLRFFAVSREIKQRSKKCELESLKEGSGK